MNLLSSKRSSVLPAGTLEVQAMKDANMCDPSQSSVTCQAFHPSASSLLATGGLDCTLRLYHIDGVHNHKVSGVHFESLPIRSLNFLNQGSEILLTGRRAHAYTMNVETSQVQQWPMMRNTPYNVKTLEQCTTTQNAKYVCFASRDGLILVCDAKTKNYAFSLKMNGQLLSMHLSPDDDSDTLMTTGVHGDVYIWSLRQRKCLHKFTDHATVKGTCISSRSGWTATGNDSGCVNLYNTQSLLSQLEAPVKSAQPVSLLSQLRRTSAQALQPTKCIMNLTTQIDALTINHSGELLCMSSRFDSDALKLVHLPTQTVFANFPTQQTPLHYVSSHAFSPHSAWLTIGNDRGRVLLYRLQHYQQS